MPIYNVEQYEIHTQMYRLEAKSEADAIAKLLGGEADALDDSQEYIEVADSLGLPVAEHRELADELRDLGISVGHEVIPSIRSVEEVE